MLNLYVAGGGGDGATHARLGFTVDDLDGTHARLLAAATVVRRPPEARPWGRSATYVDPDGNLMMLTEAPHPPCAQLCRSRCDPPASRRAGSTVTLPARA